MQQNLENRLGSHHRRWLKRLPWRQVEFARIVSCQLRRQTVLRTKSFQIGSSDPFSLDTVSRVRFFDNPWDSESMLCTKGRPLPMFLSRCLFARRFRLRIALWPKRKRHFTACFGRIEQFWEMVGGRLAKKLPSWFCSRVAILFLSAF